MKKKSLKEPFQKPIAQINKFKIRLLFVGKLVHSTANNCVSRLNQTNFYSFFFTHRVFQRVLKIIGLLFLGLAINCESITDIYPPELELLNPTEDVLTADSITFLVDATDNIGVDRVTFSLRDSYTGWSLDTTLQIEPYEISVTSIQSREQIELEITGFDAAGNFDKLSKTFEITTALECEEGELVDCNGNCGPQSWLGDGYCDDETYPYEGSYIDLNCEEHSWDDGDCSGGGSECDPETASTGTGSVISPAGGAAVNPGSNVTINWSFTGPEQVHIYLYEENIFFANIQSWTINDGDYAWYVSSSLNSGRCYHIVIMNPYDNTDYVIGTYFNIP